MTDQPTIKKLYYSISEVSKITDLKQYVLRYWETEFPMLKPSKNRAGNRIYKESDIKLVQDIKRLLYEEKFTIDGARKRLEEQASHESQLALFGEGSSSPKTRGLLIEIKNGLLEIKKLLSHNGYGRLKKF